MLETWFSCQNQCFVVWGIILDHFQKPQSDLKVKNWVEELWEVKKDFKVLNYNFGSNFAS